MMSMVEFSRAEALMEQQRNRMYPEPCYMDEDEEYRLAMEYEDGLREYILESEGW